MEQYHHRTYLHFFCILFFLSALFFDEGYSQLRKMSTKELTKESTAIVHGKCTKKENVWNEKKDKIFTKVTIQAEENLKGNSSSQTEVIIPGGRIGNIIYEVSEMPVFENEEEVIVFLWQHPSGKNLVTGALQGKFTVKEDKKTGKKVLLGNPVQKRERTLGKSTIETQRKPNKIFLDDFIGEIKKLIQE